PKTTAGMPTKRSDCGGCRTWWRRQDDPRRPSARRSVLSAAPGAAGKGAGPMTPDRRKVGGKTQPLRLLAIGHEASRSGAVIIHLGWLNWAAARPERFQVSSLLVRPGPLLAEWPRAFRVATLSHLDQARSRMERWVSTRLVDRPRFVARRFRRYLAQLDLRDIDVVLANTLTLGWLLAELPPGGCPVVVHAHELAGATGRFAAPRDLAVLR